MKSTSVPVIRKLLRVLIRRKDEKISTELMCKTKRYIHFIYECVNRHRGALFGLDKQNVFQNNHTWCFKTLDRLSLKTDLIATN